MAAQQTVSEAYGVERRPGTPIALAPPGAAPGGWGEGAVVGGVVGLVYALTLSHVPALTPDSPTYLLAIESGGTALYHPHHLAYNRVARAWLDLLGAAGLGGDPLPRVELLNALLGGCAAALVWTILRRRAGLGGGVALAATAGAAFSCGAWLYSVSIEVYMLPLVLLLAMLLVLTAPRPSAATLAGVGLLNGLAVLAGQVNVLFAVVVVVVVVAAAGGAGRRAVLARLGAYGATAAAVVVAGYGAVLALVVRADPVDWVTRYAQNRGFWHLQPDAPAFAALGAGRALVGGEFAFRLAAVRDRFSSRFPGRSLDDEAFLVRHLPAAVAWAFIAVAVAGTCLLAACLVGGVWRRRDLRGPARRLVLPLVTWLVVYSLFFLVWNPENLEFWIPQVTVVWMLAAVLTATAEPAGTEHAAAGPAGAGPAATGGGGGARRRVAALGLAAGAVALVNGLGTIVPATASGNDVYAVRYEALASVVGPGDLVVVDRPYLGVGYTLRYTAARPVPARPYLDYVPVHEPRPEPAPVVADRVGRSLAQGHRVALDAQALEAPSGPLAFGVGWELAGRFGRRWHLVHSPDGLAGWFVIEPDVDP